MPILGAIVRTQAGDVAAVSTQLSVLPGVEVALNPHDGRLIVLLEDSLESGPTSAAETLAQIARWPAVLSTSLVYEYSGPDVPPVPLAPGSDAIDYRAWRRAPHTQQIDLQEHAHEHRSS